MASDLVQTEAPVLILGIGNLLMGDEGVGVHAARLLERTDWKGKAEVLDGGTGGFHLMSYFESYPTIILIDATMDGQPAGTVTVRRARFASDFPPTLSTHDIGLKDIIEALVLLGKLPDIHLITVSIEDIQSLTTELSPAVASALTVVRQKVVELVSRK